MVHLGRSGSDLWTPLSCTHTDTRPSLERLVTAALPVTPRSMGLVLSLGVGASAPGFHNLRGGW